MADMSPHVSTVFKELFEDIKSAKQQQWTITNYGAAILAAIYWVKHQLPAGVTHLQSKLKFLTVLAIATAVLGSFLLLLIQSRMAQYRCRLDELHKSYFTRDELEDIGLTDSQIKNLGRYHFRQGGAFLVALVFVLWAGAVLVCFALWW